MIDDTNGAAVASSGGVTDDHPQTGFYYVNFGTPMVSRPIVATLDFYVGEIEAGPCQGTTPTPSVGEIDCASQTTADNTTDNVAIQTYDTANNAVNANFYVVAEAP